MLFRSVSQSRYEEHKKEETNQKTEENNEDSDPKEEPNKNASEESLKIIDPIKLMKIAVALEKKPWVKVDRNKKLIDEETSDRL